MTDKYKNLFPDEEPERRPDNPHLDPDLIRQAGGPDNLNRPYFDRLVAVSVARQIFEDLIESPDKQPTDEEYERARKNLQMMKGEVASFENDNGIYRQPPDDR